MEQELKLQDKEKDRDLTCADNNNNDSGDNNDNYVNPDNKALIYATCKSNDIFAQNCISAQDILTQNM
ncbi:hypothetical protein [Helicobacter suis]|uniref:hypothetical protein n=1 Tax=Helicobacter suis TaxID=104628 RepID=UPI0013D7FB31|nr:hypothetical protein [Helicobacter suis]